MRPTRFILMLVLAFAGSGCSFSQAAFRNMTLEPVYATTARTARHRAHRLAREAWRLMAAEYPDQEFSCEYRRGFVDGFCDYLEFGGSGEPPVVPPSELRQIGYMTPAGLAAQDDWFGGFRHGSATAKASGLRDLVKVQVHMPPRPIMPPIRNLTKDVTEPGDAPLSAPRKLDANTPTTPPKTSTEAPANPPDPAVPKPNP